MEKLMKVKNVELAQADRMKKISGGICIDFESLNNYKEGDYFKIKVDGYSYDFQVNGIKVINDILLITAIEVGYWAGKLDYKGVDLRKVVGCELIPVIDEKEKSEIYERSCWC